MEVLVGLIVLLLIMYVPFLLGSWLMMIDSHKGGMDIAVCWFVGAVTIVGVGASAWVIYSISWLIGNFILN